MINTIKRLTVVNKYTSLHVINVLRRHGMNDQALQAVLIQINAKKLLSLKHSVRAT